jgi:hypothetical protein
MDAVPVDLPVNPPPPERAVSPTRTPVPKPTTVSLKKTTAVRVAKPVVVPVQDSQPLAHVEYQSVPFHVLAGTPPPVVENTRAEIQWEQVGHAATPLASYAIPAVTSGPAAPTNTVAPVASGAISAGAVVSTTDGTWTGSPTFTYKWQRDTAGNLVFVDIGGATASSYTLVSADAPNKVRAVVTGTNAGGSLSAASNALGPVTDGIDAFTVLMLHCDGTDASTSFPDASASAHAVTGMGNAQVDTAQSVFGGASVLFDGTGDALVSVDSADWNFGSGDFTIDFRVRFNSVAGSIDLISQADNQFALTQLAWRVILTGGNLYFQCSTDGTVGTVINLARAWTPSTATWYHVAIVRTGNVVRHFVDGTQLGTDSALAVTIFNSNVALLVGAEDPVNVQNPLNGWVDELRISKGIARWTTTFTPPTAAYS